MLVVLGTLVVAGLWTLSASQASLTGTTVNTGNSWRAGTVSLTSDRAGRVLFDVTNLAAGDTVTRCVAVTYTGNAAADVRLHADAAGTGLAEHLETTLESGTGGSFDDCAGFTPDATLFTGNLATLARTHADFTTGLGGFSGAGEGDRRTYRFRMTLDGDPAAQSGRTTVTLVWEARTS